MGFVLLLNADFLKNNIHNSNTQFQGHSRKKHLETKAAEFSRLALNLVHTATHQHRFSCLQKP